MTRERFVQWVRWGGLALVLAAGGDLYFVLKYREFYRDAARVEAVYPVAMSRVAAQQQALENIIRDFAAVAPRDAKIAEILEQAGVRKAGVPVEITPTEVKR